MAAITALSLLGHDATSFAHLDLGIFCCSSLQILSSSVRLDGVCQWTHFLRSPEMLNWVEVRALAGPIKDIHTQEVVPKPLLHGLGCVLWVIVLLEGEPSAQSEVLNALDQDFIKDGSLFSVCRFSSTLTTLPVPATEKHPQQHDAATTMLHRWDGIGQVMSDVWFPPDMTLRIEA